MSPLQGIAPVAQFPSNRQTPKDSGTSKPPACGLLEEAGTEAPCLELPARALHHL